MLEYLEESRRLIKGSTGFYNDVIRFYDKFFK